MESNQYATILKRWNIIMGILSIIGVIAHSAGLFFYLFMGRTFFGLGTTAGDFKIPGECGAILYSIILFVGVVYKKHLIPVLIYWIGICAYAVGLVISSMPYLKLLRMGMKLYQLFYPAIVTMATFLLIIINIGCTIRYMNLLFKNWGRKPNPQPQDVETGTQVLEVLSQDQNVEEENGGLEESGKNQVMELEVLSQDQNVEENGDSEATGKHHHVLEVLTEDPIGEENEAFEETEF